LKIFKLFTNDFILFIINIIILASVYFNYVYKNYNVVLFLEMFGVAVGYYFISLLTSLIYIVLLYLFINSVFTIHRNYTIFKKLEIISFVFNEYYDDINSLADFRLAVKKYLKIKI